MARKKKKTCWGETKKILNRFEKEQFIDLIYDLYRLSSDNKNFFHTRFSIVDDPLSPYKSIIQGSLHPYLEENETIDFMEHYCNYGRDFINLKRNIPFEKAMTSYFFPHKNDS